MFFPWVSVKWLNQEKKQLNRKGLKMNEKDLQKALRAAAQVHLKM